MDKTIIMDPYPIYCRQCKQEIDPAFDFCPSCGASQRMSVPAPNTSTVPIPPAITPYPQNRAPLNNHKLPDTGAIIAAAWIGILILILFIASLSFTDTTQNVITIPAGQCGDLTAKLEIPQPPHAEIGWIFGSVWQISSDSGTSIQGSDPQGWSVSFNNPVMRVCVPREEVAGSYHIEYFGQDGQIYDAHVDVGN